MAAAIGRGLERAGLEPPDLCPIADGGEGTLDVLLTALGGETAGATVADPLGRPRAAGFGLIEEGATAIVELAQASGLDLMTPRGGTGSGAGRPSAADAERASTRGTGELIAAAIDAGAEVVLVAAGGSATTDGGAGAIAALEESGGLRGAALVVLCDVRTPFEEAAVRFAPQKGADDAAVERLTLRLAALAATWPRDPRGVPMTGAAGGLSGGLWAHFGARLEAGAPFVLEALGFDARMRAAHAVVTGEGRIDRTSLEGKAAGEVAIRARQAGVPAHAIVGTRALDLFDQRILDLQTIREAGTLPAIEAAAEALAADL
ncbi:MAG: glycerate 2-kinase [Solirubrobacteraceae bacterium]|nr:glycerate 2-kinase [Solirubrobacteraceae bacterium]